MGKALKSKQIMGKNLLDLRPRRLFEHTERDGKISVQVPRFRSPLMAWFQKRLRRPYLELHLDELGSHVWLACDGHQTVEDIGRTLRERFGESIEPVWDRLGLFIQHIYKGQLIALEE